MRMASRRGDDEFVRLLETLHVKPETPKAGGPLLLEAGADSGSTKTQGMASSGLGVSGIGV